MKNTKRILALVLSLAMMVGMIATVGAAGSNAWYMPAVSYIENCGIDTIGTKDATPITRNDFVYWVAKIMTHQLDDEAWDQSVLADIIVFNDVTDAHHKAAIASSYQRRYIKGDGNGNFYPDAVLTLAEAATVIVRMLGYGDFVTYDENNWEYSYIEYAAQKGIIDTTFWSQTLTADPDYELTFGEAAYLIATVMNYTSTDATPQKDLILTWDGENLGEAFRNGVPGGKHKATAIVTELDYEWDDQDTDVSNYVKGFGVNYTTRIVDLDGFNSLGTNTSTAAGAASTNKHGTVDATDVISDATTVLVCFYTDGSSDEYEVATEELQGFVRVSLGLDAEVGEDEEWELGEYIYNGTALSVTFDNDTNGIYAVEILDQLYVDTYIVATALSNKYVTGWTANERGSADYTMVLPTSYTEDKHFDVEATRYLANGEAAEVTLTIGGKTYDVVCDSLIETSMDEDKIIVVSLDDVAVPLLPQEVIDAIPNTAEGEVSLVFDDINGDGSYDIAVVQENFWFSYRNYVNARPASDGFAKSIPMGGVVIDALAAPSVSVSTDPYTLDASKKTNKVQLVIVPTNDRYVYQYGSYGAGENAYDGLYCLPAYKIVDLMPLKTAYIESATALATDGYYEVVFVNTDGSRTTAYVPMPGETVQTYTAEDGLKYTVYKTVKGELVYNALEKVAVTYTKGDNTYDVQETSTGKRVYKNGDKYYYAAAFKEVVEEAEVTHAVDSEATLSTAEVSSLAQAYDNKIVYSGSSATVTGWTLVEDFKNGSFTGVAGDEIVIATSEVAAIVPYTVATYVPATRDFEIEVEGAKTTVTLDSTTWNSFVTEYVFNEDTGISSVADREDTAAWMVGHYVKYALDDESTTIVLIATEAKAESGLIVNIEKTNTGDNTFNVTMGVSGAIANAIPVSVADTYWVYMRCDDAWSVVPQYSNTTQMQQIQPLYTIRDYFSFMGFTDVDAYADSVVARAKALGITTNPEANAVCTRVGNMWAYTRNIITSAKNAGYTVTGDETLADLRAYNDSAVTSFITNLVAYDTSVTATAAESLKIKTVLEKYAVSLDFDTMVANVLANKNNVATNTRYGYMIIYMSRFACAGSYYKPYKAGTTAGRYSESYWYTTANHLKGPTSVVTHEVRVSASTVLWDYDNYLAYNNLFSAGRLVKESTGSTEKLTGFDLTYGTFYSDAGKLYTLVISNEANSTVYAGVIDSGNKFIQVVQAAQSPSGDYRLQGGLYFHSLDANEAGSFLDYTELVVLSTEYDQTSKVDLGNDSYTMNVDIRYAYLPYYLKIYAGNNIASYERYWTAIVDAVAVATFTPVAGRIYRTYIPVVDENGVQIAVETDAEVTWWETQTVDSQGVAVEYKVINNLVYKVNTVGQDYEHDDNGDIVYEVEYNTDLAVVKAAIAAAQAEAAANAADYTVTIVPTSGAKVTSNVVTANRGDTVTITVALDDPTNDEVLAVGVGYTENGQTWTVIAEEGETEGTYTFVMPDADVVVEALVISNNPGTIYTYAATVADTDTAYVTIVGDPDALEVGTKVSFKVEAEIGFTVTSVVVTDADDATVATTVSNGVYSFTMPETDVTITVETEALDFYIVEVEVDVLIPDEDVVSLISFRKMDSSEEGWIPNAYAVTVGKDTYVAAGNRNVIVMTPDFTTGNVTGVVTTIAGLADSGKGLFYTKFVPTTSGTSMTLFTVIGEICNADGGLSTGPVEPGIQTTKVYLASGKSVITMDETGNYYYVTSIASAVTVGSDDKPTTTQVGAISVRYNTYVEAVYASVLKPVLTDGGTYYIDNNNIVVG